MQIMATRRHIRALWFCLLAALLISPPLTSAVAEGLGIDLAHHHCESAAHDDDANLALDQHPEAHGAPASDPYHCDQCHAVVAALALDMAFSVFRPMPLPTPDRVSALMAVRVPPAFRPPIA